MGHELKGQVKEGSAKVDKLQVQVEEVQGRLTHVQGKLLAAEAELNTKSEVVLALEAAKASQRVDLESHIQTVTASLDTATVQLSKLQGQLDQVGAENTSKKEKIVQLETKLSEQEARLSQGNTR